MSLSAVVVFKHVKEEEVNNSNKNKEVRFSVIEVIGGAFLFRQKPEVKGLNSRFLVVRRKRSRMYLYIIFNLLRSGKIIIQVALRLNR